MSWTFNTGKLTKEQVVAAILADYQNEDYTILDHAVTDTGLYIAVNCHKSAPDGIMLVYALRESEGKWYWKGMYESMGPSVVDCPLSLLELVPGNGGILSIEWRQKVRAFHGAV